MRPPYCRTSSSWRNTGAIFRERKELFPRHVGRQITQKPGMRAAVLLSTRRSITLVVQKKPHNMRPRFFTRAGGIMKALIGEAFFVYNPNPSAKPMNLPLYWWLCTWKIHLEWSTVSNGMIIKYEPPLQRWKKIKKWTETRLKYWRFPANPGEGAQTTDSVKDPLTGKLENFSSKLGYYRNITPDKAEEIC